MPKLTAHHPKRDNSKGIKHPIVVEDTVNERLKILMRELNLSIASFASALGVKDSTIRNYFEEGRQSKPGYDFFERLNRSFGIVNMSWLFGGEGPPLLSEVTGQQIQYQASEKNSGNIIGQITGGKNKFTTLADCAKENEHLRTQVALLTSQLADKDGLIQSKQEIIDLLKQAKP